jgi:hypothetical protein
MRDEPLDGADVVAEPAAEVPAAAVEDVAAALVVATAELLLATTGSEAEPVTEGDAAGALLPALAPVPALVATLVSTLVIGADAAVPTEVGVTGGGAWTWPSLIWVTGALVG